MQENNNTAVNIVFSAENPLIKLSFALYEACNQIVILSSIG